MLAQLAGLVGIAVVVLAIVFLIHETMFVFKDKPVSVKETPYSPPLRYSIHLLREYKGHGMLKAVREAWPFMPITVAKEMVRDGRVIIASDMSAGGITPLALAIHKHAPDANARVVLDGTDVGFTIKEWEQVHHGRSP
jgi:hypothetical protein